MQEEKTQRHFLYHIFKLDKAENPMPPTRVQPLLDKLWQVFKRGEEHGKK